MSEISRRSLIAILGISPALAVGAVGKSEASSEDLIAGISRLTQERNALNEKLAEGLRQYSRSQKTFWQKMPYLIVQNEGRSGYSDWAFKAYGYGLYPFAYILNIDLENGELLDRYRPHLPADTASVLQLSWEDLDAEARVREYEQTLSKPEKESGYRSNSIEEINNWRNTQIARFNLNPHTYKRTCNLSNYSNYFG